MSRAIIRKRERRNQKDDGFRIIARLAQNEESGLLGGEAGSGGGLELEHGRTSTIFPSLVPHLQ